MPAADALKSRAVAAATDQALTAIPRNPFDHS